MMEWYNYRHNIFSVNPNSVGLILFYTNFILFQSPLMPRKNSLTEWKYLGHADKREMLEVSS